MLSFPWRYVHRFPVPRWGRLSSVWSLHLVESTLTQTEQVEIYLGVLDLLTNYLSSTSIYSTFFIVRVFIVRFFTFSSIRYIYTDICVFGSTYFLVPSLLSYFIPTSCLVLSGVFDDVIRRRGVMRKGIGNDIGRSKWRSYGISRTRYVDSRSEGLSRMLC